MCLPKSTDCCLHCEQCLYFDSLYTEKKKKEKPTQQRLKMILLAKNTVDRNREFIVLFCRLTCVLGFIIGLELSNYAKGYS